MLVRHLRNVCMAVNRVGRLIPQHFTISAPHHIRKHCAAFWELYNRQTHTHFVEGNVVVCGCVQKSDVYTHVQMLLQSVSSQAGSIHHSLLIWESNAEARKQTCEESNLPTGDDWNPVLNCAKTAGCVHAQRLDITQ